MVKQRSHGGHGIRLIGKLRISDPICVIAATFTLASCVFNFQGSLLSDDGFTNKEYSELATGIMEVVICGPYIVWKWHEFVSNLLPTPAVLAPLKAWTICSPNDRIFRDTIILVLISYLILLDINWSFVWVSIFPIIAIVFIGALYSKIIHRTRTGGSTRKGTQGSSHVAEEIKTKSMEVGIIVMMTLVGLLGMDRLPAHKAAGFVISQFLLFLSCTVAALTRMMMKLPAGGSPGIAPASEMLYKTLLLLLLVTAHTVAAEWLGEDVVMFCLPEVIPVLLWFSLHLDRKPGSSSIITVDKLTKPPHRNWLIFLGTLVVVPLFAYLANSTMDEAGLFVWCTTFQVSCGVSGILTYYIVFMLSHWPRQQVPAAAGKDGGASGMLKLWAYILLIGAAASEPLKCFGFCPAGPATTTTCNGYICYFLRSIIISVTHLVQSLY